MAKRVRYYYDEASCLYLPVKPSFKSLLLRTLSLVGGSAVIASLIIAAVYFFYDSPKEALLKKQNAALVSQIRQLDQHLAMLEGRVDSLHIQDNNFYRSLLSADRVDDNEWNVGVGGSAQAPSEGTPEELLSAEERLARLQSKIDRQTSSYGDLFNRLEDKEDELRHVPAIKPVNGAIISGFGMRNHPIHKIRRMHTGLDMEAAIGTPVYAAGDGTVILAGQTQGGYGLQIEVKHGNYGFVTKYAHLSRVAVNEGQQVKRGDVIGYTGNSGLSKGPHLHYEIIKNGEKINPIDYFYGDLSPKEYLKLRQQADVVNESMD